MAKHRTYSIEFKRQVVLDYLGGETLRRLSKRHDTSRNLIRVWIAKYEAGECSEEAEAADLLQQYEAKISALERLVGRQALEIEFLKGALKNGPGCAVGVSVWPVRPVEPCAHASGWDSRSPPY